MKAQEADTGSRWTETEQSGRIQAVDEQKQSRVAERIQFIVVCTEASEAKAAYTQRDKMKAQETDTGSRWTETEQSSRIQAVDEQKQSRVAERIQSIVVCTEGFIESEDKALDTQHDKMQAQETDTVSRWTETEQTLESTNILVCPLSAVRQNNLTWIEQRYDVAVPPSTPVSFES
jgi:hypothetical protein